MRGWKPDLGQTRGYRGRTLQLVTLVCLALMALLLVVQVAHVHPLDSSPNLDHCPLCVVLQTAAPVAATAMLVILVQVGRQATAVVPVAVLRHRHPKLFTRPPPLGF